MFQSSSIHQFGILYNYFVIRWLITLKLIKLMTDSGSHHTIYSLLKKTRWREVNRQKGTNNMFLTLLFKIKRRLSISFKRSVWIRHTSGTTSITIGTKRYYEMLRGSTRDTTSTTRHCETTRGTTSSTTR